MKSLYKIWEMDCFGLDINEFIPVYSKLDIKFVRITQDNYMLVKEVGKNCKTEKKQLKNGDTGFFALLDNKVVGYGWYKDKNSRFSDKFYRMKRANNLCYLCRFFVCEDMRGNNIYPAIITYMIECREKENPGGKYYISAYSDNVASIKGLLKVGFKFVSRYKFVRLFKMTVNKQILS